jgi:hypothetical protein
MFPIVRLFGRPDGRPYNNLAFAMPLSFPFGLQGHDAARQIAAMMVRRVRPASRVIR